MSEAKQSLIKARVNLLLSEPWFGSLAMRLQLVEDEACGTACTNGTVIRFAPSYIAKLTGDDLKTLLAEEVLHSLLGHPWRMGGRNPQKWNQACDIAIYHELAESHFCMTAWDATNAQSRPTSEQRGKSAEWIYDRLPDDEGSGNGNAPGLGGVSPAGDGSATDGVDSMTPEMWKQAAAQATLTAKAMGKLPANVKCLYDALLKPVVDWRSVLRKFITARAAADYTWKQPNTRYLPSGLYLPSLRSESMGELAIAVDTSASMDAKALGQVKAELDAIISECNPAAVTVYYADAAVAQQERFEQGEPLVFNPKGGGGTDFRPVFEALTKAETQPVCLIYLTDLEGTFPVQAPSIPTLWVTSNAGHADAPFGQTVRMS